jgi:hypothetical protein
MKEQCGMSQATKKGIYDFAVEVGARTSEWYATTETVPEDVWITVEKLNAEDQWVELLDDEIPDDPQIDDSPVVDIPTDVPSPDAISVVEATTEQPCL